MRRCAWRRGVLAVAAMLAAAPAASAEPVGASAERAIHRALTDWMLAFNAGDTGAICGVFAPELRYDFRGFPERGFDDVCRVLQATLADQSRKYAYSLAIRETIVSGDLAVVRLVWTLTVKRPGQIGGTSTTEPGLDVFRRQPDGSWKIIRYLAYEE
jgi:ketosteroid isomerase-like protein